MQNLLYHLDIDAYVRELVMEQMADEKTEETQKGERGVESRTEDASSRKPEARSDR